RGPHILDVVEPARSFLARADAAVPRAAGLPARAGDAERALEHEALVDTFDRRIARGGSLPVDASPRAERCQLDPGRPVGAHQPVNDAHDGAAVEHRELTLDDDVSDLPAPPRYPVLQLESHQQLVPARVDGSVGPLV